MKITRRALLIANPGESSPQNREHYCAGVYVDITNYRALLMDPIGGAWLDAEIVSLRQPSVARVIDEINKLAEVEYSLIAFSGHGAFSTRDRCEVLEINPQQTLLASEFRKGAKRRTIILNCCREIIAPPVHLEERTKYAQFSASQNRLPNAVGCRLKFDQDVFNAAPSTVVMHSSTPPEPSNDNEQFGGVYPASLFQVVDAWRAEMETLPWNTPPRALSVVSAHDKAASITRELSNGKQNPYIEKPITRANFFPFAVFA